MMQDTAIAFRKSEQAFQDALNTGRLNDNPPSFYYVGRWMYMGTWNGLDQFKNIHTREYLDGNGGRV